MAAGGRLSAEERRRQILQAARAALVAQGHLPLAPERLAAEIGISKALIYAYFPDQADLANAIAAEDFARLAADGLGADFDDLEAAAVASAELYFRHVCAHGPALHVILRDPFMRGRLAPAVAAARDRAARPLVRLSAKALALPAAEAVGAFSLVLAIPEEAGRLVWQGELSPDAGLELCRRLTAAAVQSLQSTDGR
ncbi:TetR/AcrR family transcriptional regulator [Phenylobacterium sp. LjRoot164]|uniref:TetR/AcrR family transcriptional regulator n=1 Tax=unclassified Phenylobacterium TaxID=2640670 RepID=UPI003ED08399